jgi:hypothetical protein
MRKLALLVLVVCVGPVRAGGPSRYGVDAPELLQADTRSTR